MNPIERDMPGFMSEKRYAHVQRVSDTAVQLAERWNHDTDQAKQAGLYHDICKEMTPDSIQAYRVPQQDTLSDMYAHYPAIWHAHAGPVMLRHHYGMTDADVLDAIKWHTTGSPTLSPLAQIIYVSDFIEPGRSHPFVTYIHHLAMQNMDEATFATAWCSIQSLLARGRSIHPDTMACYNSFHSRLDPAKAKLISEHMHENPSL